MSYLFSAIVDRLVDQAPPLDESQRDLIVAALSPRLPAPSPIEQAA